MVNGGDIPGLNFGKGETEFQGVGRGAEAFIVFALEVHDKFGVIVAGENVLVVDGLPFRGPGCVFGGGENVVDEDGMVGSDAFRVHREDEIKGVVVGALAHECAGGRCEMNRISGEMVGAGIGRFDHRPVGHEEGDQSYDKGEGNEQGASEPGHSPCVLKDNGGSGEDKQDGNGKAIRIRSRVAVGVELVGYVCNGRDCEEKAEQGEKRADKVPGENSQSKQRDDEDTGKEDEEEEQTRQGRENGEAGAVEFDTLRDGERKVEKDKEEEELGGEK